jgi:hypothetical protein
MTGRGFISLAKEIAGRQASARHQRRAAEARAKKPSIPAMKKIIRRNKQRQK